jgi:hypothetical protein
MYGNLELQNFKYDENMLGKKQSNEKSTPTR